MMTQADKVLFLLRERAGRGVHTFELRQAFIGNPSQRIRELTDRGHQISVSRKERLHGGAYGVRYRLVMDYEKTKVKQPPNGLFDERPFGTKSHWKADAA